MNVGIPEWLIVGFNQLAILNKYMPNNFIFIISRKAFSIKASFQNKFSTKKRFTALGTLTRNQTSIKLIVLMR